MAQYMVERYLSDVSPDQLPATAGVAKQKSAELTAEDQDIRSKYVPEDEKCYCLFETASKGAVEGVQHRAGLPFEQIHEAAFVIVEGV